MNEILEVKNVEKKYQSKEGEVQALKNVNFRIKKGEFVSIIGPSGCGKQTIRGKNRRKNIHRRRGSRRNIT